MKPRSRHRFVAAWLALAGLLLQVGLATEHSARHFDHLVGPLGFARVAAAHAADTSPDAPRVPSPDVPAIPGFDHCAVGLGLAASANLVLADSGPLPAPRSHATVRLDDAVPMVAATAPRRVLPPARAPPAIEIFA